MYKTIIVGLTALSINMLCNAGTITIQKSDSVIRNDVFDAKRVRAEEYRRMEAQRQYNNLQWSTQIPPSCMLLRNHYLIYRCSGGLFYKGYEQNSGYQYRQMSAEEVQQMQLPQE